MRGPTGEGTKRTAWIPGVEKAYRGTNSYSGFIKQTFLNADVTLAPGTTVTDVPALLNYVIAIMWSANQLEPNQVLSVGLSQGGATVPGLLDAAKEIGWTSASMLKVTDAAVFLALDDVRAKLGGWPGVVPAAVPGALAAPTAAG